MGILGVAAAIGAILAGVPSAQASPPLLNADIVTAFGKQGIRISAAEAQKLRGNVLLALAEARSHGIGNSKVDFAAVEIATDLHLDTSAGSNALHNVVAAMQYLLDHPSAAVPERVTPVPPARPNEDWSLYYDQTVNLWSDSSFMGLVRTKGFQPVKISWEDIGRDAGSSWGDRISDVGIWVRKNESDPESAQLALSVRRDNNFRDKILLVPAAQIKIHQRIGDRTVEKTLPARLAELGLSSATRDKNVIVSNQFAIAPVPAHDMHGAWPRGVPPRAAFTFSIFPYGSTNFVITDVIEGSHEAVVGPGQHQLLFARVGDEKAPFTASRAEDRPDLLKLERELKAQGMDVDVQRYYLIQIPLRRGAAGVQLSSMGTPPRQRTMGYNEGSLSSVGGSGLPGAVAKSAPAPQSASDAAMAPPPMPMAAPPTAMAMKPMQEAEEKRESAGLAKVAIGHGVPEGPYFTGAGYGGTRADEPIRVTVVYFVTPVGRVTRKDMEAFTTAFSQWDSQAIWGGSFVTKETN
jgi:hypothetical protein